LLLPGQHIREEEEEKEEEEEEIKNKTGGLSTKPYLAQRLLSSSMM